MKKKLTLYESKEKINIFLSIVSIFFINFSVNSWISLKAQCLDDLSEWTLYNTTTTSGFIFNTGANKFRPVYNVVVLVLYKIFGKDIYYFQITNLLISFLIACVIFFIAKKLSENVVIGLFFSIGFIVSRFAYYQISQVFGIMEAMALLCAILIICYLQGFLNSDNKYDKEYYFASFFYSLVCLIHERYIALVFIFIIVYFLKEKFNKLDRRKLKLILVPIGIFIGNMILRKYVIGSIALEGTGGTNIVKTFNVKQIFMFIFSQIAYIFGINLGGDYLNGINYKSVAPGIYLLIAISILVIIITLSLFIKVIVKNNIKRKKYTNVFLAYIFFIGICIVCSSMTIRVEMRWIYVSFTAMLLLLAYMLGVIKNNLELLKFKHCSNLTIILALVYIITLFPTEIYYRNHYNNLYFWGTQKQYNSLYNLSVKQYGDAFWTSNIFIIHDRFENVTVGSLKNFYSQFKTKQSMKDPNIIIVSDISEISSEDIQNNSIILGEDVRKSEYIDLTQILINNCLKTNISSSLKKSYIDKKFGVWEGNIDFIWTGKEFGLKLKSKDNGEMVVTGSILDYNLPNVITVYANSKEIGRREINDKNVNLVFDVPKNEVLDIKVVVKNTMQPYKVGRGEDKRDLGLCLSDIIMN